MVKISRLRMPTDSNTLTYGIFVFNVSIEMQTAKKVERSIASIKKGMNKVIPHDLLSVFHPF